jgi:hypothetical protein
LGFDAAPVPIRATWENDLNGILVEFDSPLQDSFLAAGNWRLTVANRRRRLLDPNVFGDVFVGSQTSPFGIPAIGSKVSYLAVVEDLIGLNGVPVEAFIDFPVNLL